MNASALERQPVRQGEPPEPDSRIHRQLAAWIAGLGGQIHGALEIVYDEAKGFFAVVREGQGLAAETRIATCPVEATISALNVLDISPFQCHGTVFPANFIEQYRYATDVLQSFFLMEQHVLGDTSFWSVYLKTLPTVETVNELQFESDEDHAWIRGTNLEAAIASQSRRWQKQFKEANDLLIECGWKSSQEGLYNYELFRWASGIFGSRSFTSKVLEDTKPADMARPMGRKDPNHEVLKKLFSEHFAVLLPLLDILNHRPSASIEWIARPTAVDLKIGEAYTSGQEVFNNYGPRDNEGLLLSYGFVLPDNPFEHVLISVNAHPGTPLEIARTWPKDDRSNDSYNCYIFDIGHPIVKEAKYLERALFSYDLLDSISVMCSNDREFQAMYTKQQTLMSTGLPTMFDDNRNLLATLAQIMYDSGARAQRIEASDPSKFVPPALPRTHKQRHALTYRQNQVKILRAAEGVCAFTLLRASSDQDTQDLLLSMQLKLPSAFSAEVEDICTRLSCITAKKELFTATGILELLPSPTSNGIRSCIRAIEAAVLESIPSHMRAHQDKTKTIFTVMLSALCLTHRSGTELPRRLRVWCEELTSSYPPDDPNWNYVPPPGPHAPGEEPPAALMLLLGALPKVQNSFSVDSTHGAWLKPEMICWAWNVMEEEGMRIPVQIEKFISREPSLIDGPTGFLLFCKQ